MKKVYAFILSILLISLFPLGADKARADDNLVPNPSVELSASPNGDPASWNRGYLWGNLDASYSYSNSAHTGKRSLRVEITRYQTGDAKWYFNSVSAAPNTTYRYADYYTSNISTDLVAQIENQDGSFSYQWLTTTPASNAWKNIAVNFVSPATTKKISVFHVIAQVGWLQTDDFYLAPRVPGLIPNSSFEDPDPNNPALPQDWQGSRWGTNKAAFSYLTSGHTGSRSVKVTLSRYSSGDAKWSYNPIAITPNQQYTFSDFYQSNTNSRVVVWVVLNDSSDQYISLKTASASANWTQYSDTFTLPSNASKATVFHLIESNGFLAVDDYNLMPVNPTGFTRGLVSLTFDDGWETSFTNALPLLKQYGFVSTQYYVPTFLNTAGYQTDAEVQSMIAAGNEVASHTMTHVDLTTLPLDQLDYELSASKDYLQNQFGVTVHDFASPYGTYNQTVITEIQRFYDSHRPVDVGYNNHDSFDIWRLKVQNITVSTTPQEVNSWVQDAYNHHYWLILVYHRVTDQNPEEYDTTVSNFQSNLQSINASGIHVATVWQAIEEITSQL